MCDDREKLSCHHSFIRHCATTARDDRGLIEDDDDVLCDAERDLVDPARATRGRARGGASRKRRGRRLWDIIISSSDAPTSSSNALGRRGAIAATTSSIALALTTTRDARAAGSGTMCGYFDDFGGGLVPKTRSIRRGTRARSMARRGCEGGRL